MSQSLEELISEQLRGHDIHCVPNSEGRSLVKTVAALCREYSAEELEKILPENQSLTDGWKYECEKYIKEAIARLKGQNV